MAVRLDGLTRVNQAATLSVRQSIFLLLQTGGRDHTHRKRSPARFSAQFLRELNSALPDLSDQLNYTHAIFSDDNSNSPSHRYATSGPPLATL